MSQHVRQPSARIADYCHSVCDSRPRAQVISVTDAVTADRYELRARGAVILTLNTRPGTTCSPNSPGKIYASSTLEQCVCVHVKMFYQSRLLCFEVLLFVVRCVQVDFEVLLKAQHISVQLCGCECIRVGVGVRVRVCACAWVC